MAVDEHEELPQAIQREAELQRQIVDLQGQVTELHRAREDTNPELSSEFQILKEKIDEHSKQLEQSAEKLSQLESENLTLRDENQALNTAGNKKRRFWTQVRPMPPLETPNSGAGPNLPTAAPGGEASTREKAKDSQTYDGEDINSEPEPDKEVSDKAARAESPMIAHLHEMFSYRLDAMQSMVERLPGVAPPIQKSNTDSYADTPFTDEITLIEIHSKFSFPSIKSYNGTTDRDYHVAQYRQRMLAEALPKGSREATMCKSFGSTLTRPALQWYINLPSRSIASFAVLSDKFVEQFASSRDLEKTSDSLYEILQHRAEPLRGYIARFNQEKMAIPKCSIPTAISAFKRGMLPDGDLYKELTKYQCKTMEDVLSRAWAQVKWEEDVTSRAKAQQMYQNQPIKKAEGMTVPTWPDVSHLSVSRPELINVLRQMGQQCDFHRDHGHKKEDCVALKIEVNELLRKGHLMEFLSEKAKSHLRKETMGKPTEAAPVSPPRQDRVIHVISGGSEVSGISHAAAKKSTWNAKHGLDAAKPKRLLLGTDEISFTAKEQEKVLTPHHDALVISLTIENCLVKRILEDNGSSGTIIFQATYKDLGLEEGTLTHRTTLKGKAKVL
ncbi:hypothetical protein F2Q69_00042518 [Brassica cretica]|uniref:Retrotransposon gag domain-containing protein n=1 Tax=Brassica cretica TaxID=69181 RepID=A0A8S9NAW1_BRACR|nr:hypothetical protein F2Q69_00042518 [Brassica cretica]